MVIYSNPALYEEPLGQKPVVVLPREGQSILERLESEGRLISRKIDQEVGEESYNEDHEVIAAILGESEPYAFEEAEEVEIE
jgi:hypothetical protein